MTVTRLWFASASRQADSAAATLFDLSSPSRVRQTPRFLSDLCTRSTSIPLSFPWYRKTCASAIPHDSMPCVDFNCSSIKPIGICHWQMPKMAPAAGVGSTRPAQASPCGNSLIVRNSDDFGSALVCVAGGWHGDCKFRPLVCEAGSFFEISNHSEELLNAVQLLS